MNQISTLRSLLENNQVTLDRLLSLTDGQLNNRGKLVELTSALQQEREAADELIAGLRDVHIGSGPRGMGYKGKRAHLEALLDEFGEARDEASAMLREGGDARAEARLNEVVENITGESRGRVDSTCREQSHKDAGATPAASTPEEEEEEVRSLTDVIAQGQGILDLGKVDEEPDTARATSLYDSVRRLGLRKNAITALEDADIHNLGQLISQTPDYLLSLHQFGATSLDHVLVGLDALDLEWPNGRLFRATGGAGETPLGRLTRGNTEEHVTRRHKAAAARQYYHRNRKKILKKQAAYRRAARVRLQELETKVNERGNQ